MPAGLRGRVIFGKGIIMSDLISRQVLELWNRYRPTIAVDAIEYDRELKKLLGTNLASLGTDCISRQAAIKAIDECYCGGEDSCGEPWVYIENAVESIQMIEPIPPAEPNKDKVSNLLYHIYSIQSPHLDMSGVIAKKYYCEELWKELFGKESELPKWMT